MKLLIILLAICSSSLAQKNNKSCNIELMVGIERRFKMLRENDIQNLLETRESECDQNVEFSEYFNSLLFRIAENYSQEFLNKFTNLDINKRNLILKDLENNLEEVDFSKMEKGIKNSKGSTIRKSEIITAISKNR